MSRLADWLRAELDRRGLAQGSAAVYAGVGQATISDMLTKGHVPKVETLFRLADYFGTPREEVLRLAGHLPPARAASGASGQADEALVQELIQEFHQVPDEWKEAAIQHVRLVARLASRPPLRIIGEEAGGEEAEGEAQEAGQAA